MKAKLMGIISMLCSMFACNAQTNDFKSLSVEEYAKAIEDTMVVRLDVRTPEEYAEGHIEKSLNIDVLNSDFESKALATLPKDKTIAVNCRSGKRSKNAARILVKNGYKVIELDSGYNGWIGEGKPVVK
ncbi:MAG: rhodanese-like domain-containing protein [Bacteroidaceae bacterium]|nr:rhodanese-like domain-containing protein [Bacteroidaceae bacterium]